MIQLITGIPRSGTTLCCKLLNQREEVIALHEPINPAAIVKNADANMALAYICKQIAGFQHAIENGLPFEHGDKGGLEIDNPVGQQTSDGIRQVVARRGQVLLPKRVPGSYQLVVKQNALFTALLGQLSAEFAVTAIVRNPVDVLLSWLTVDLPVNRGRIPAGERFATRLAAELAAEPSRIRRQWRIYKWFMYQFHQYGLKVLRYEDILASNGSTLDKALGLPAISRQALTPQQRQFAPEVLQELGSIKAELLAADFYGHYSTEDIAARLRQCGL
ncbi:sulfotransferase family protein [Lacimicrobium alkaliphilum]|uniref:Sulfotransferase domain-containing protein n=1 Tax=Lacimicrobium alkaliphilum TaxID=1526571 RepID=A0A0U3AMP9_9ALTE|nr:sulfotransferase family protein [Lacimicrobium alkaliphilum]ALS99250.1 hypothetical protein AT746_13950 [Lacimicrobium alkaliphilum]